MFTHAPEAALRVAAGDSNGTGSPEAPTFGILLPLAAGTPSPTDGRQANYVSFRRATQVRIGRGGPLGVLRRFALCRKERAMRNRFAANSTFSRSVDSAGWALFFVWVGVALLADIGWRWSLIGTAIIVLGVQLVLSFRKQRMDVFMTAVGAVLLIGTIADMFGSAWSLVPAFLIVIGVVMLIDTVRGGPNEAPQTGERATDDPSRAT